MNFKERHSFANLRIVEIYNEVQVVPVQDWSDTVHRIEESFKR